MKDVRNKQLRNKLNKLGIKDIVLNFDSGFVSVWSEDDLTDTILHYADNTIETRIFGDFSVEEWIDMIKDIFDEGLDSYERSKEIQRNSNGHFVIGKQIKEYALYQYENIDIEKILLIANDISNGDFTSAFKYCK